MRVPNVLQRPLALSLCLAVLSGCAASVRRFPEGGLRLDRPPASRPHDVRPAPAPADLSSLQDFIRKTNRWLAPELVERIAAAMARQAAAHDVDVRIVAAMIAKESSFNPKAVSSSGAIGLGQLLPGTAKWLGVQDSYDPEQNIAGACLYLKRLCAMWPGPDWERVLASYRLGQGTIRNALAATGRIPPVGLDYARSILATAQKLPVKVADASGLEQQ